MALYILMTVVVVVMGYFINCGYHKKSNSNVSTVVPKRQEMLNRVFLFGIFLILFGVSASRIGTGNDYWIYRNNFLLVAGGDKPVSYEIGFKAVILTLQYIFGLDCFLAIFGFMAFFTCAFFVKGIYDNGDCFAYTMFLFMANGFYFMSFSNVRYYFAIAMTMYAMKFLFAKKHAAFVIWICIAALFHMTVLLVIPVYYVAYYLKWSKKTLWLIPVAIAGLIAGRPIIRFLIFKIYPYYQGNLLFDNYETSYVNIAKCGAILVMCLIFYKDTILGDSKAEMLFNLNLFALLLYSFAAYIPEISRICYYMVIGQIFLIPKVLLGIKKKPVRIFFTAGIFLAYSLYFAMFLRNGSQPGINILPYLTWMFD